jgi:hypothetical protein
MLQTYNSTREISNANELIELLQGFQNKLAALMKFITG